MQDAPTVDYVARFGCGNQNVSENLDIRYCIGPRFSEKAKGCRQPKQDRGIFVRLVHSFKFAGICQVYCKNATEVYPQRSFCRGKWVGR